MIKENIKQYFPENAEVIINGNVALFEVSSSQIKKVIGELYINKNLSFKIITATDERKENGCFKIWYVFGASKEKAFIVAYIKLRNTTEFPSLTSIIHAAWNYEKKIHTFFGLTPIGHPDLRPIILHGNWPTDMFPLRKDFNWQTRPNDIKNTYKFQKVGGEGIYEIPVGPIHAGIIEPGHFRFSVAGENIVLLEPKLGFTHKGSEKLFEILPITDKIRLSEKISGDSSFSHSLAFCHAIEQLSSVVVPKRAKYLRTIYAELERLANHFGDIGAIMVDTGFNFGGAQGARLREMILQINERITGNRFLRKINTIGGVTKDIDIKEKNKLSKELANIFKDFSQIVVIARESTSLLNRLKNTGVLSQEVAKNHGVVGIAGKAVGIVADARIDYPYAAYSEITLENIATEQSGDVYARFNIRIKEVSTSIEIIKNALQKLPEGRINVSDVGEMFKKNALSIGIVEGWRGEIIYFVTTDSNGKISRVYPRDPSFINWAVIGEAGFNNVVPDFPLINKSFNLSYSGNDL